MKTRSLLLFIASITLSLVISGCYYDNKEDLYLSYPGNSSCDTNNVTYSKTIDPIFASYCSSNSCHGGSNPQKGISTSNHSSVTSNIDKIRAAINENIGSSTFMPKDGNKLSTCDLSKIDIWIRQGMLNN